jgi:hypothetical protein
VAYLLFLIGLSLIVFELFTRRRRASRAWWGAGCLVLGCYGLARLPTNLWRVGCSCFAMFGFAIDVADGCPAGVERHRHGVARDRSVLLYDGLSLSWITLLVAIEASRSRWSGHARHGPHPASPTQPSAGCGWWARWAPPRVGYAPDGIVRVRDARGGARTQPRHAHRRRRLGAGGVDRRPPCSKSSPSKGRQGPTATGPLSGQIPFSSFAGSHVRPGTSPTARGAPARPLTLGLFAFASAMLAKV